MSGRKKVRKYRRLFGNQESRKEMDPVSSLFRRASRATPWRATEEALDAFHMEGGGPPPPKKTVEKVLSFELKALAQPPGSAVVPAARRNSKYPISNKEYPRNKGAKQKTEFRIQKSRNDASARTLPFLFAFHSEY